MLPSRLLIKVLIGIGTSLVFQVARAGDLVEAEPDFKTGTEEAERTYPNLKKLADMSDEKIRSFCPPGRVSGLPYPPSEDTALLDTEKYRQAIGKTFSVNEQILLRAVEIGPKITDTNCYAAIRCYRDGSKIVLTALGNKYGAKIAYYRNSTQVGSANPDQADGYRKARDAEDFTKQLSTDIALGVKAVHDMMDDQCKVFVGAGNKLPGKMVQELGGSFPTEQDELNFARSWGYSSLSVLNDTFESNIKHSIAAAKKKEAEFNEQAEKIEKRYKAEAARAQRNLNELNMRQNNLRSYSGTTTPGTGPSDITGTEKDLAPIPSPSSLANLAAGASSVNGSNLKNQGSEGRPSDAGTTNRGGAPTATQIAKNGVLPGLSPTSLGTQAPAGILGGTLPGNTIGIDPAGGGSKFQASNSPGSLKEVKGGGELLPTITGLEKVNLASSAPTDKLTRPNLENPIGDGTHQSGDKEMSVTGKKNSDGLSPSVSNSSPKAPSGIGDANFESKTTAGINDQYKANAAILNNRLRERLRRNLASESKESGKEVGSNDAVSKAMDQMETGQHDEAISATNRLAAEPKTGFTMDSKETEKAVARLSSDPVLADQQSGLLGINSPPLFERVREVHMRFARGELGK